jgi:hypothetical protein
MPQKSGGLLIFALFLSGCTSSNHQPESACTCEQFPFASACESQCDSALATVEAVDPKKNEVTVRIQRGPQTEVKTIPLAELPIHQLPEKGAQFRLLSKKDAKAPQNPRITRIIEEPPHK